MRYDLKTPCKNCPFVTTKHRIRFSCRERAEQIAEQAYRQGFPCHKSAAFNDSDDDQGGYYDDGNAQHCAGAIIMFLNDGNDTWPGIDNDEELGEKLAGQMNMKAKVFAGEQEFIEANDGNF